LALSKAVLGEAMKKDDAEAVLLGTDAEEVHDAPPGRPIAPSARGGSIALEGRSRADIKAEDAAGVAEVQTVKPRRPIRRVVLTLALLAGLTGAAYYGHYWWTEGRFFVSTDDAYVRADMSVIAAKVTGYVTAVSVTDNTSVRPGDVLAQIDDRDYKIAVESAQNKLATEDATIERLKQQVNAQRAAIEQAKAQVASTQANLVRTIADFERAQTLADREFGTRKTLDQARADRDQGQASVRASQAAELLAEASLAVLDAQVKEAEHVRAELQSSVDKVELDLSFTSVKAPFAGVVGNRAVQVGQYVQAGTRLLSLVPLDTAYVEANYKETQLDGIRPGQRAEISVDAASGRVFKGVVESIAPAAGSQYSLLPPENATGNFTKIVQRVPVRIRVSAEAIRQGVLRPGLSVRTYIDTRGGNAPRAAEATEAAAGTGH
jgi:membrane fusion protein (multidrug efflux system)